MSISTTKQQPIRQDLLQRKPEGNIGEKSKRAKRYGSVEWFHFPILFPLSSLSFPPKYSTISSKHDLPPRGRLGTHTAFLPGPPCRLMDLMRKTTLDQPLSGRPPCLPRQDRSTNKVYLQNTPQVMQKVVNKEVANLAKGLITTYCPNMPQMITSTRLSDILSTTHQSWRGHGH